MNQNQETLKIRNLVNNCTQIQNDLNHFVQTEKNSNSAILSPSGFQETHCQIKHLQKKVSLIIKDNHKTAADLPIRSRRAYQWLSFLSGVDSFRQHIQAIKNFHSLFQQIRIPLKYRKTQPSFHLCHISPLYQIQVKNSVMVFQIQESFLSATRPVYLAILQTAYGKNQRDSKKIIRNYTRTTTYRHLREKLEYLQIPRGTYAAGNAVDLEKVFRRVNKSYFQGSVPQPHLVWSIRPTYRKFGHYAFDTDTVMVSKSLDSSQVPEFVLDYIMYHEILHKRMGTIQKNGQNYAHTPEYKTRDKEFPFWSEAQDFLAKYAQQIKQGH